MRTMIRNQRDLCHINNPFLPHSLKTIQLVYYIKGVPYSLVRTESIPLDFLTYLGVLFEEGG